MNDFMPLSDAGVIIDQWPIFEGGVADLYDENGPQIILIWSPEAHLGLPLLPLPIKWSLFAIYGAVWIYTHKSVPEACFNISVDDNHLKQFQCFVANTIKWS